MFEWIKTFGYEPIVIATKLDKLKRSEIEKNKKIIRNKLVLSIDDPFIVTSSDTKQGIEDVLNYIESLVDVAK